MTDKDIKISITAPSFKFNDKEYITSIQKILLLTLYENGKINFNQYNHAVELIEKKFCKWQAFDI